LSTNSGDTPELLPLDGIRILDLADESAVFAGRILADLGADVICVEPPEGSRARRLAPHLAGLAATEHGYQHLYHNANKRSVVLDRNTESGQRDFRRLLGTVDALIETERMDHDALAAASAGIIHVTVTPFGLDGPRAHERGNDLTAVAAGGLATFCGHAEDPPNQPGAHQAFKLGGLAAATGTLIALVGRRAGSGSVHLDISLQACVAATTLQSGNPNFARWFGETLKRPNFASAVQCGDGRWMTGVGVRPATVDKFLEWARAEGLDPPPAPDGLLPLQLAAFYAPVTKELISRIPRDQALAKAQALGMLGTPIHALDEMEACEQLQYVRQFVEVPHEPLGRTFTFPKSAMAALGELPIRRAPLLGEHSREVLEALTPAEAPGRTSAERIDMANALAGIRVVDFCWVLAGPLGTRLLANFGAEVIRVEAGARGMTDRTPPGASATELGSFHNIVNTQKRSITIDPRSEAGQRLLLELIDTADVVTENYRAGSFARMGFDYDTLHARNPRLVLAHLPGLGSTGPWRNRATYGPHVAAAAGVNFLTGFPHRRPLGIGTAYPDFTSPYILACAVIAALEQRARTGEGAELDVSQLTGTIAFIGAEWLQYKAEGEPPSRNANRDPNYCPHGVYATAGEDQWIALAVDGDATWRRFCAAMECPQLADDPRFISHALRKDNEDALDNSIGELVAHWDKWVLARLLQEHAVAASPVEDVFDMLDLDPQLGRRFYQPITRASAPDVEILITGEPIQEAAHPRELRPAPVAGADNAYVVCDLLGYSDDELAAWMRDGTLVDYT
jgi:crotonobetainyl-CoA:carnitine CoA-transferase CaiB-like acyl-CoA transferase